MEGLFVCRASEWASGKPASSGPELLHFSCFFCSMKEEKIGSRDFEGEAW